MRSCSSYDRLTHMFSTRRKAKADLKTKATTIARFMVRSAARRAPRNMAEESMQIGSLPLASDKSLRIHVLVKKMHTLRDKCEKTRAAYRDILPADVAYDTEFKPIPPTPQEPVVPITQAAFDTWNAQVQDWMSWTEAEIQSAKGLYAHCHAE